MDYLTFANACAPILAEKPGDVMRESELGNAFAFTVAGRFLAHSQELLRSVPEERFELVPDQSASTAIQIIGQMRSTLGEISSFAPTQTNSSQIKSSLEETVRAQYRELFSALSPVIGYLYSIRNEGERASQFNELRLALEARNAEAADAVASIRTTKGNLDRLLEESRTQAAELISTKEAIYFDRTALNYGKSAAIWLVATIFGVITLVSVASYFLIYITSEKIQILPQYGAAQSAVLAQSAVMRLVVLGIIAYLTNLASRNYFASKHNEVVNRHRENAILSYRALVEATGSPEHRDVILTHAAAAVFAPQDTAFVKPGASGMELPATIVTNFAKPSE